MTASLRHIWEDSDAFLFLRFPFLLHPKVHPPVGERHAERDAHQYRETLLHAGERERYQQRSQKYEITQNRFHTISVLPVAL